MATSERKITRRTVDAFLNEAESWKVHHHEANACGDFEELLAAGNSAFDAISRWDTVWHQLVNDEVIPFDSDEEAEIHSYYRDWLSPSDLVLGWISAFEQRGYHLVGATLFHRNREDAEGLLTDDTEFFGESFHSLEADAIAEDRRGETLEFKELGD